MGLAYWIAFSNSPFHDVTLVFEENEEIKTCRVLLFKFFDYFHALMTSGMKDSNSERIQVENVTKGKLKVRSFFFDCFQTLFFHL